MFSNFVKIWLAIIFTSVLISETALSNARLSRLPIGWLAAIINLPSEGIFFISLFDIEKLLKYGSDKILLNTAALDDPNFINEAAKEFGSQCIVVSIDVLKENSNHFIMRGYGKEKYNIEIIDYIKIIQEKNAGEIFIQSINMDGSLKGYDLSIIDKINDYVKIPLIISSGAGSWQHVKQALKREVISAASLTNIFHFTEKSIINLKNFIKDEIYIRK